MRVAVLGLAATLVLSASLCAAIPVPPTPIPIARLLKNVGAYAAAHPKDPDALYTLGCIHYFAFASPMTPPKNGGRGKPDAINAVEIRQRDIGDPPVYFYDHGQPPGKNAAAGPSWYKRTPQQQVGHVRQAVTLLGKALELRGPKVRQSKHEGYSSDSGLYELCLACALEEGMPWAKQVGAVPGIVASGDPKAWREAAITYYRLAAERAFLTDREPHIAFGPGVTEEAGQNYKRLVTQRDITPTERTFLTRLSKMMDEARGMYARTPIVFSLDSASDSLTSLLAPQTTVSFDMDGSGRPQQLSWVKPDTGILVWDEDGRGRITSGRQLFGSVTWWMFWQDGYRALDALDDDRDGWLTGGELKGLGVWFDRNQNGVSEPGEVIALSQTQIAGIATQATGRDGLAPMNAAGLRLRDGRTLPTFDWVVTVVR